MGYTPNDDQTHIIYIYICICICRTHDDKSMNLKGYPIKQSHVETLNTWKTIRHNNTRTWSISVCLKVVSNFMLADSRDTCVGAYTLEYPLLPWENHLHIDMVLALNLVCMHGYMYIYIYIHISVCINNFIHMYIYRYIYILNINTHFDYKFLRRDRPKIRQMASRTCPGLRTRPVTGYPSVMAGKSHVSMVLSSLENQCF